MVMVASSACVFRHGMWYSLVGLSEHRLLTFGATAHWVLMNDRDEPESVTPNNSFHTDTIAALHACALAGRGIAAFTLATVQDDLQAGAHPS